MSFESGHDALFRVLTLLLVVNSLEGCIATSYVLTIGGRETYGEKVVADPEKEIPVEMKDAPLEVQPGHGMVYIGHASKGTSLGTVTLNPDDIKWADGQKISYRTGEARDGEVELVVGGAATLFEVRRREMDRPPDFQRRDTIYLEHRYRRWYGYPAQVLLVVAVPADVLFLAVALPIGFVYSMIAD